MTDRDFWKAKYFEAQRELTKANKGLRRLHGKNRWLRERVATLAALLAQSPVIEPGTVEGTLKALKTIMSGLAACEHGNVIGMGIACPLCQEKEL